MYRFQSWLDRGDRVVVLLRLFFIALMVLFLVITMASLATKLVTAVWAEGALAFETLQLLFNDALFVLIILAVVRTLFINDSFTYALTFLEVGFVVLLRKLILLETTPEEAWVLLVLGLVSALFFGLIVFTHYLKHDIVPEVITKLTKD
jgi:hypothetical protein